MLCGWFISMLALACSLVWMMMQQTACYSSCFNLREALTASGGHVDWHHEVTECSHNMHQIENGIVLYQSTTPPSLCMLTCRSTRGCIQHKSSFCATNHTYVRSVAWVCQQQNLSKSSLILKNTCKCIFICIRT